MNTDTAISKQTDDKIKRRLVQFFEANPLINSRMICDKMGYTHGNWYKVRIMRGFPKPVIEVDNVQLWLESEIDEWNAKRTKRPNSGFRRRQNISPCCGVEIRFPERECKQCLRRVPNA